MDNYYIVIVAEWTSIKGSKQPGVMRQGRGVFGRTSAGLID